MDFDPTDILFTKIRSIEPENVNKIVGYILIQDFDKRYMARLAFGPDALLHSLILKAKTDLGLSSNTMSSPPSQSHFNPISRPVSNPLPISSPRMALNGVGFDFSRNPSSPSSSSWPLNNYNNVINQKASPFLSYDSIRSASGQGSILVPDSTGETKNAPDMLDERQLNDYLSFLNDSSSKNEELVNLRSQFGYQLNNGDTHLHRRSYSASDAGFGSEEGGLSMGMKPCMYYVQGFCKNGDNCRFMHGETTEGNGGGGFAGSPNKMDFIFQQQQKQEQLMRMNQERLAAAANQFLAAGVPPQHLSSFLMQQQNDSQRAAASMLADEYCFGPNRFEMGMGMAMSDKSASASRQIYLTFPADSTFRDEDVSVYFSNFGQVHDVRIPYQAKRMFGFVTFVHPDTAKLVLARGNPHFICESRVLVKPYKEKGKVFDRKQMPPLERGNFSPGPDSPGINPRVPYDFLHLGSRMHFDNSEILRRRIEEQEMELQRRRLMSMQFPELKEEYLRHHQRSLSIGSPTNHFPSGFNPNIFLSHENAGQDFILEANGDNRYVMSASMAAPEQQTQPETNVDGNEKSNEGSYGFEKLDIKDSTQESNNAEEHGLPDTLFASPSKPCDEHSSDAVNLNKSSAILASATEIMSALSDDLTPQ